MITTAIPPTIRARRRRRRSTGDSISSGDGGTIGSTGSVTPGGTAPWVERVQAIAAGAPDLVFDAGPVSGVLPDLVRIAGGNGGHVLTVSNHGPAAESLGVHNSFEGGLRYDALAPFAKLAAEGRFTVPVARTFPLEDWREALDLSLSGHAGGKLILMPANGAAERAS